MYRSEGNLITTKLNYIDCQFRGAIVKFKKSMKNYQTLNKQHNINIFNRESEVSRITNHREIQRPTFGGERNSDKSDISTSDNFTFRKNLSQ